MAVAAQDSDEVLMARVQTGDESAWRTLWDRWRRPVFTFLVRRTCAVAEAEDALQETWVRLWRHRQRYDPSRPFRPWLFTLAANVGRDAHRPNPGSIRTAAEDPDTVGLRDLLVSALHALDARDRRILLLTVEGFDAGEIAGMLGMRHGAVRMRLSRARARIREWLHEA